MLAAIRDVLIISTPDDAQLASVAAGSCNRGYGEELLDIMQDRVS